MKSSEEMTQSLFERREAFEKTKRIRRGRIVKGASLALCVAVAGAVAAIVMSAGQKGAESDPSGKEAVLEGEISVQ